MNPAKLSRHLSTKHPAYKDRTTEHFAKKQQQLEVQKLGSHKEVRKFSKCSGELDISTQLTYREAVETSHNLRGSHHALRSGCDQDLCQKLPEICDRRG
ncbi:unnamed protein product [Ixodes pacificus]